MSAVRSLLVHLDACDDLEARLDAACALARRHDAELTALYASTPSALALAFDIAGTVGPTLAEINERYRALARQAFDHSTAAAGLHGHWQQIVAGAAPLPATVAAALVHDLVVLGQRRPGRTGYGLQVHDDVVESTIIASGQPALVVPYTGAPKDFGAHALVAWKPTRESARAVHAALPLLRQSRRVDLVAWGPEAADSAGALQRRLALHGIECRLDVSRVEPEAAGEMLLSRAAELGADLLVMGCYGRSRAREWVAGGVTRTMLAAMTLPLLMAH